MKKRLSLLMVLMMVLSLVPMSVFAASGSVPGGVISLEDTDVTTGKVVTVKLTQSAYTKLTAGAGNEARLTLSDGAEFSAVGTSTVQFNTNGKTVTLGDAPTTTTTSAIVPGTFIPDGTFKNVAHINMAQSIETAADSMDILLKLVVDFEDLKAGDITLTIEEMNNSGLEVTDPIKVAVVKEATSSEFKMVVSDSETKIGMDGGKLSKIEIKDFASNADRIDLELPDYLDWKTTTFSVSLDGNPGTANVVNGIASINLSGAKTVLLQPVVGVDRRDASIGDITLKATAVDTGVTPNAKQTVSEVVGQIADYNATIKAVEAGKKVIPSIYGGESATIKVTISGVEGTFTNLRPIDFTVEGADVTKVTAGSNLSGTGQLNTKDDEFTFDVSGTKNTKLEFTMDIKADYSEDGEVVLTAESRDFGTLEVEVAKVTPAFTVEVKNVTNIKKGESLATADVVIKEAKAGMLGTDQYLVLNLNDKNRETLSFASDYTVEATNGLKVDDDLFNDEGGTRNALSTLVLEIDSSSVKEAGTITISDVVVNVDGATVDGVKTLDVYVVEEGVNVHKLGATTATVANDKLAQAANSVYYEEPSAEYEVDYVNVVKEYGTVATTTVFVIGSKTYTVNGVQMTANEAPYVAGKGYTMLPVRALAESLGLKADWNSNTKTATFSNDSKVASVTMGSDTMYVNGTPIPLNAKAEIKNGSTFIELRSLASAFGVELQWDAATKTVTIVG